MDQCRWIWETVGTHDMKMTQSDSDTSNDMSYEDACAIAWKGHEAGKGAGKKGPNWSGAWHRETGAHESSSGRDDGGKKVGMRGSKGKSDGHSEKDKGREKARARAKGKSET